MDYDALLQPRKSVHISLLANTHAELKVRAFKLKLTMQDVLSVATHLIVQEDPYITRKLLEYARQKRDKQARALEITDADTMLDEIEAAARRDEERSKK